MTRVISWNVNWRIGLARDQGQLLRELRPDIVVLREVNAKAVEALLDSAGLAWMIVSAPPDSAAIGRQRLVAVGGDQDLVGEPARP